MDIAWHLKDDSVLTVTAEERTFWTTQIVPPRVGDSVLFADGAEREVLEVQWFPAERTVYITVTYTKDEKKSRKSPLVAL